ncbi:DUF3152 domain-containing protein [Streptomyces sp. NPDC059785]|uniref:DUF3152 domain-containing protein n=1 Tax=Streptomyces sp. NPDC059785 TaxID=3346945 RepID=UPI003649B7B3
MGRHSRRGRAGKGEAGGKAAAPRATPSPERGGPPIPQAPEAPQAPRNMQPPASGTPPRGVPRLPDGTPARGVPRYGDGTPARGVPRLPDGTPARGVPRLTDSAPGVPGGPGGPGSGHGPGRGPGSAHGVPRSPDGTPARGVPRFPDGTPARGVPRFPDGTPAHGVPRSPGGTPARGVPQVRGGHPEQREGGGGWGDLSRGARGAASGPGSGPGAASGAASGPHGQGPRIPRQPQETGRGDSHGGLHGGPRQEYLDAFEADDDVFASRQDGRSGRDGRDGRDASRRAGAGPGSAAGGDRGTGAGTDAGAEEPPESGRSGPVKGGKGLTFAGIAAAAVTTVLAVIVAGQVAGGREDNAVRAQAAGGEGRGAQDSLSRGDGRPTQSGSPSPSPTVLTYDQKMAKTYPLGETFEGSGKFDAVTGLDKAPGKGRKWTYRVDVEHGLGLDAELFAQAVQKTLNDDRSWAHNGARTFERISSGKPDFVITLASPGTTATWCAKSGLDTTEDNVSCDSAATARVMINAYRWAQGSPTYGDRIHAYRQMLINHEVGHRLGYGHVTCDKDGSLAPVMQQQTKFLDHDGIHCLANPWPFPGS